MSGRNGHDGFLLFQAVIARNGPDGSWLFPMGPSSRNGFKRFQTVSIQMVFWAFSLIISMER